MRRSRATRWRIGVLFAVHLVFLVHIWHLVTAGETLSPLEPSESMQLVDRSIINAGLIFFGLTILATLIFGRFFCGWACHMLALQDLCHALLLKLGFKPKPLRSKALMLVPLAAAAYMFVWPAVYRLWVGGGPAYGGVELTTTDFWETFPHPAVAVATFLVCGFALVWALGSKAFCAYACPYGAFFGLADRVAPGRIRVDDSCDSCGHCTVACTSNVAVAQEVRDWGMVVDAGCMKCMDCVSVCPQGALSFGFGKPALKAKPRREPKVQKALQSSWEEVLLLAVFVAVFFAVRGLWIMEEQRLPFLFSLGIAGFVAGVALAGVRLVTREKVGLQNLVLKRAGRLTVTGRVFAGLLVPFVLLLAHTGFVRWTEHRAERAMEALTPWTQAWFGPARPATDAGFAAAVRELEHYVGRTERWAFVPGALHGRRLTWLATWAGDVERADALAWAAFEARPDDAVDAHMAADLAAARGDLARTRRALTALVEAHPERHDVLAGLVPLLAESGAAAEALALLDAALAAAPNELLLLLQHASVSLVLGRLEDAEAKLEHALRVAPERPEPKSFLAEVLAGQGRFDEARAVLSTPEALALDELDGLRAQIVQ